MDKFALLLFTFASPAFSQVSAALSGTVTGQSGATIAAAAVIAKNSDTGATRETMTDDAGRYRLLSLPVGEYEIDVKRQGFTEKIRKGVVNFTSEKTGGIGVSNSTAGNNFVVSGNRPQQNLFLLNGVEFTGAAENNMQPGGVTQELLGVDAIHEFNLLTDSYNAEYGKHTAAQVVIVTRQGTNQFHGALFEFLRNNDLNARNL